MYTPAQYRLAVVSVERRRARGLNPDDTPTRYELKLDLTYTLTEIAGGKVVLKGAKPIFISTDAVVQPYASVAAQQDAELRAATEAAELIRTNKTHTHTKKKTTPNKQTTNTTNKSPTRPFAPPCFMVAT